MQKKREDELLRTALERARNYPEDVIRRAQGRLSNVSVYICNSYIALINYTQVVPLIYKPINTYTDEELITGNVKPNPNQVHYTRKNKNKIILKCWYIETLVQIKGDFK